MTSISKWEVKRVNKTNLWAEGLMSWNATTFSSWQKTKKNQSSSIISLSSWEIEKGEWARRTNGVKETSGGVGIVHDLAEYTRLIRSRHFFSRSKFDKTGFRFQSLFGRLRTLDETVRARSCRNWGTFVKYLQVLWNFWVNPLILVYYNLVY